MQVAVFDVVEMVCMRCQGGICTVFFVDDSIGDMYLDLGVAIGGAKAGVPGG